MTWRCTAYSRIAGRESFDRKEVREDDSERLTEYVYAYCKTCAACCTVALICVVASKAPLKTPTRHPLPVPARISFRDGFRRLYLDTTKVKIIRGEHLHFGIALIFAREVV